MTPTADLMRLVEKWPLDRHPDPHTDAWTLGYLRAKRECADELQAALTALRSGGGEVLTADDVEWVVNDTAELGVRIHGQCFFLYKGNSLVYETAKHDDGAQMYVRTVGKREFGECCRPINHDDYSKKGTVSLGDSDRWEPMLPTLPHTQPARGEAVAWARQSGDPNDDAFVISAKVKRLWLASNPKRVARYTRPLYTTHVPCWALPAVESALSMLDLQGYWHSDLAAFRDWLKEKSQ